jgi:hypothetical protein
MLKKLDGWSVIVLLGLSLGLNVYLGIRTGLPKPDYPRMPTPGTKLATLIADNLDGASIEIDWASDKRPTLVYVFGPNCSWCWRNLSNIKWLSETRKSSYRFIGLSTTKKGLKEYLARTGIAFPVYVDARHKDGQEFIVNGTPETLVVLPDGTLKEFWPGAFSGHLKEEIESKLHVVLPGLGNAEPTHIE